MSSCVFGLIGVHVEGYSVKDLRDLFESRGLSKYLYENPLAENIRYSQGMYLQSESRGILNQSDFIYVLHGYISYTTDLDTYMLILQTALLDVDTANELVTELYIQGKIKPRNSK